jgi:hypothetical protein
MLGASSFEHSVSSRLIYKIPPFRGLAPTPISGVGKCGVNPQNGGWEIETSTPKTGVGSNPQMWGWFLFLTERNVHVHRVHDTANIQTFFIVSRNYYGNALSRIAISRAILVFQNVSRPLIGQPVSG